MKVILHIGVEKTGTTSIQNFLAINFAKLKLADTVFYGGRLLKNTSQSTELVLASVKQPGKHLAVLRNSDISEFRERVKAEIRSVIDFSVKGGVTRLLFSSEHMSSRMRSIEEIELLKSLFPPDVSFEIVVYCRRQDELYLGTLAEGIKAGVVHQESLDWEIELGSGFYSRGYYDYNELLSMWSDVFGKENIKVCAFERSQLKSGDILVDFLSRTLQIENLSDWRFPENRHFNRRLSAEFLYFLSNLNKTCSPAERASLLKHADSIDTFSSNTFIPVSRLEEFLASFEESNKLVAQNFLNRESLFTRDAIAADDYTVANDESLSGSMEIIRDAIKANLTQG